MFNSVLIVSGRICFKNKKQNQTKHKTAFRARPAVRQALGDFDGVTLPTVAALAGWLSSWERRLSERARWVSDDAVEEAALPSDVANVRDVAALVSMTQCQL